MRKIFFLAKAVDVIGNMMVSKTIPAGSIPAQPVNCASVGKWLNPSDCLSEDHRFESGQGRFQGYRIMVSTQDFDSCGAGSTPAVLVFLLHFQL